MSEKDEANRLATAHWDYIEETLIAHKVPTCDIDIARYHYCSAFIHGFKHGVEYADEGS
jgi:hypothetical protein